MNAKDLRVGNLLLFKGNKVKIESVEISYCEQYKEEFNETFKPIELTDKDIKQYGHFNLIKVNEEYFVCFGNYKTQVKFYHELQNYYYLVNHEEL